MKKRGRGKAISAAACTIDSNNKRVRKKSHESRIVSRKDVDDDDKTWYLEWQNG